jgi:hypothetical protein
LGNDAPAAAASAGHKKWWWEQALVSASPLLDFEAQAETILRAFARTRMEFGLKRIELGTYLAIIRDSELWKGRAESWEAFLAENNLNPNAMRQYMRVARKFVLEMKLSEEALCKLAMAGITALEKAISVISEDNQDEIIASLTSLSERDAIQRIVELSTDADPAPHKATMRVLSLLKQYHNMPPDLQVEFREKLGLMPVPQKRAA